MAARSPSPSGPIPRAPARAGHGPADDAGRRPALTDPARFAEASIAARGLFALERLLHDPAFAGAYACALTRATAADLARMAAELEADWRADFAPADPVARRARQHALPDRGRGAAGAVHPGGDGAGIHRRPAARPPARQLRPAPSRAGRGPAVPSQPAQRRAVAGRARTSGAGARPRQPAAPGRALRRSSVRPRGWTIRRLDGVADPARRLKIEILQQRMHALRDTMRTEVGGALGVSVGFNAADGD
ncbi:MAG: hypothetical protein MZV49_19635 [Rhodopseudomonas palustris]|nr:hypothetical protein [Rhodopseudomonas palustris]